MHSYREIQFEVQSDADWLSSVKYMTPGLLISPYQSKHTMNEQKYKK